MKNAYQRRRVKARVEKRRAHDEARRDHARLRQAGDRGGDGRRRSRSGLGRRPRSRRRRVGEPPRRPSPGAAGEARLIARDDAEEPADLDLRLDGRRGAAGLPGAAGFMRNRTQERIEELARERAATHDRSGAGRGGHRVRPADDGRDDRDVLRTGRGRRRRAAGRTTARLRLRRPPDAPARKRRGTTGRLPQRGPARSRALRSRGFASGPDVGVSLLPHGRHRAARRRAEPVLGAVLSRTSRR